VSVAASTNGRALRRQGIFVRPRRCERQLGIHARGSANRLFQRGLGGRQPIIRERPMRVSKIRTEVRPAGGLRGVSCPCSMRRKTSPGTRFQPRKRNGHWYLYEVTYTTPRRERYLGPIDDARGEAGLSQAECKVMAERIAKSRSDEAGGPAEERLAVGYQHPLPETVAAFAAGVRAGGDSDWRAVAKVLEAHGFGKFRVPALREAVVAWERSRRRPAGEMSVQLAERG
jgi:hypothetical protein